MIIQITEVHPEDAYKHIDNLTDPIIFDAKPVQDKHVPGFSYIVGTTRSGNAICMFTGKYKVLFK